MLGFPPIDRREGPLHTVHILRSTRKDPKESKHMFLCWFDYLKSNQGIGVFCQLFSFLVIHYRGVLCSGQDPPC